MNSSRLRRAVFWALFPPFIPQALWLKSRAPRTPPPEGPRDGRVGQGPAFRLLGLGDSIIAGVGTGHPEEALTAQIARRIAPDREVHWRALGESGLNLGQILARLVPGLPRPPQDLVVVSAGVNDVTGLTAGRRFRQQLDSLAARLREHSPDARVVLLGVPPMGAFPLLPQPLRWLFGQRALALDAIAAQAAAANGMRHIPTRFDPGDSQFADDGYHPNAASVGRWADYIVANL